MVLKWYVLIFSRYLATTHFEPTYARAAFPCFDEPDLKAVFQMKMIRDDTHFSLFNMPLQETRDIANGREMDVFYPTVQMSPYLVAFVVCDFKVISIESANNIKVSFLL